MACACSRQLLLQFSLQHRRACPLTCPNPCRESWSGMSVLGRFFMILVIIFHITSTNPMNLYSSFTFGSSIMVDQVSSYVTLPSQKVSCAILTKVSHLVLYGLFSHVASLVHIFRRSSCIPEVTPDLTAWRLCTATNISLSLGVPSGTTNSCISYVMGSPYRDNCL